MNVENHIDLISSENDSIRIIVTPSPDVESPVETTIEIEPPLVDMAPKSISAPLQPSVIKITPESNSEKKSTLSSPSSPPPVDKRSLKPSSTRASKIIQDFSPSSSRSSRSPPTTRAHSRDKRSGEKKLAKRVVSDKSQSSRPRPKGSRTDLETLLPKLGRVMEEQGLGHTMHRRTAPQEATATQRNERGGHRAPKYVRPVDGPRRRRHRSLLSSPSLVSILSTLTTLTSSSSGSNSTITPQSSIASSQKPAVSFEVHRSGVDDHPPPKDDLKEEKIDVFRYLETDTTEDLAGWQSSPSSSSSDADSDGYVSDAGVTTDSPSYPLIPDPPTKGDSVAFWQDLDAVHSDSGISMGDSSPDLDRAQLHYQQRPLEVDAKKPEAKVVTTAYPSPPRKIIREKKLRFCDQPSSPKAYIPSAPPHIPQARLTPAAPTYTSKLNPDSRPDPVGYGFLAATLSTSHLFETDQDCGPIPLYRKFEPLKHRVLLHLQDELMDLEDQLECMDDCIARQSYSAAAYSSMPPRADSRRGNILHDQRTEILGRIFLKLNQYNQFLGCFKTCSELDRCDKNDIDTYKKWLRRFSPVTDSETRFLEREGDLVRVSEKRRPDAVSESARMAKYAYPIFAMGFLLTILAFVTIKSILGRLLMLFTIVGAGWWAISLTEPELGGMLVGEGLTQSGLCFGVLVVCAVALG